MVTAHGPIRKRMLWHGRHAPLCGGRCGSAGPPGRAAMGPSGKSSVLTDSSTGGGASGASVRCRRTHIGLDCTC
jgi:hypothetical protein